MPSKTNIRSMERRNKAAYECRSMRIKKDSDLYFDAEDLTCKKGSSLNDLVTKLFDKHLSKICVDD